MTTALRPAPPVALRSLTRPVARSRRLTVLLAGLALVSLAGLGGASLVLQQDEAARPVGPVPLGVTVAVGGMDLTVTRFDRRAVATTRAGRARPPRSGAARVPVADRAGGRVGAAGTPRAAATPGRGQERVDVSVVVRARAGRTVSVDPDRFRLTSAGRPVDLLQPVASTLSSTPLPSGAAMRGGVALLVPAGTRPLELAYGDGTRVVLDAGSGSGAAHDGAAHDGAAHDGAAHDGVPHDGVPHDGDAHDGVPHDGGAHGAAHAADAR